MSWGSDRGQPLTRRAFLRGNLVAGGGLLLTAPLLARCAPASKTDRATAEGASSSPAGGGAGDVARSPDGRAIPAASSGASTATAGGPSRSLVVVASDPGVLGPGTAVRRDAVRNLLFSALCRLTGAPDARAAFGQLVKPGQRVGLKVNGLAGLGLSTHPELVLVVVDGLNEAGVRPQDILIWDRSDRDLAQAGFRLQRDGPGVRTLGTEQDYEREVWEAGAVGSCFSRLLTRSCDVVFSLPVLKDHDLAGISGGMKNFYGAIHNPNKYHDDGCSPFIADLFSHRAIRDKVVLTIFDALRPQCHGGPAYVPQHGWPMGGIILSRDPVAADATAWRLIEEQRKSRGLATLEQEHRSPAGWLGRAVALGLGRQGPDGVDVVHV